MFEMKGRYSSASVKIDNIDQTTRDQIQGFLDHPSFEGAKIAIMPDCHAGKGAVVGFTMPMTDVIIPNIIGVDIGCGMLMNVITDFEEFSLQQLDDFIKCKIPAGFHINETVEDHGYLNTEVAETCARIGIDPEKALKAVGSLGGGNHFIEAGLDSSGRICITIHSGSRNLGKCVAEFYQKKAVEHEERHGKLTDKDLAALPVMHPDGLDYLHDMAVAQRFASVNRKVMMKRITDFLGQEVISEIESVHNFIGDDNIIRKGATPARIGEMVIIPFNMRDGLALCRGRGNADWNNSAPHGAGRILSRTQAKKQLNVDDFRAQMGGAGVYTTTATKDTLDEAPGAYKDKDVILGCIGDSVEVVDFIQPVYNFKSAEANQWQK